MEKGLVNYTSEYITEEPDAVVPHVRICVGAVQVTGRSTMTIEVIVDKSNKPLFEVFFEGCQSLKGMFLQMPLIALLVGGAYVIFSVAVMSLILIVWIMAAEGIKVGHTEGKRISLEGVCAAPKTLEDPSTYQSCRKIKTAGGQELIGRIIYRNDDYMYFVTNDGAYELTNKREVNMHVEYVKQAQDEYDEA